MHKVESPAATSVSMNSKDGHVDDVNEEESSLLTGEVLGICLDATVWVFSLKYLCEVRWMAEEEELLVALKKRQ